PRAVYRMTVDYGSATVAEFRLSTPTQRVTLTAGGRVVVPVYADRRGYAGPIELSANGLPAGVTLEGAMIPPESDGTLVTVVPGEETAEAAITTWHGRANGMTERPVRLRGHPLERLQPWLAAELAIAPTTAGTALSIDW